MTNQFSDLSFVTPPENQGQIVEVSYAADWENEQIVFRSWDASDGSECYGVTPTDNLAGEFEPHNCEPTFADDGLWETVE